MPPSEPQPPDPNPSDTGSSDTPERPSEQVLGELLTELGRAFDYSTPLAQGTLGQAVEHRLRSLEHTETPEWGTGGSLTQLARESAGALDFYYRPHLFPEMDPALRLGHRLQFDLLPRQLPEGSLLRLAAVLESYCHLSGDLLGWRREGAELFLWIADVSGHGVRAGLASASLYFLIRDLEAGLPPGEFARRVNETMLAARNPEDQQALFATAVFLRAGAEGRIRYASCGHPPALLRRAASDVGQRRGMIERLGATGRPLGLLPEQSYGEAEVQLEAGDVLCLFTDGLLEARDPEGEELGVERIAELLRPREQSPLERTRTLYRAAREHRTTTLLDDDLTFLVAARAGGG